VGNLPSGSCVPPILKPQRSKPGFVTCLILKREMEFFLLSPISPPSKRHPLYSRSAQGLFWVASHFPDLSPLVSSFSNSTQYISLLTSHGLAPNCSAHPVFLFPSAGLMGSFPPPGLLPFMPPYCCSVTQGDYGLFFSKPSPPLSTLALKLTPFSLIVQIASDPI